MWSVLRILFVIDDPLVVFGGGGAGAWSVLRILLVIDDRLVDFGGRRRCRVERPENSVRNRRPSRGFRWVAALPRGVSSGYFV